MSNALALWGLSLDPERSTQAALTFVTKESVRLYAPPLSNQQKLAMGVWLTEWSNQQEPSASVWLTMFKRACIFGPTSKSSLQVSG